MMYRVQTIGTIEEVLAPSFTLTSARDGTPISLYAFRHRQPVGLVFLSQENDVSRALTGINQMLSEFRQAGATLLVITREPLPDAPPAPVVLVDREADAFRRYECTRHCAICLFGLDRYGAIVHHSTCEAAELTAALWELLKAIEFSEMQCPE